MRGRLGGLCLAAAVASGCGGGGSGNGSPTAPSPTASSVSVTLRDVVLVGTTAAATATATLSNGQTQPVTTGWRSDTPAVATVTESGGVTGVSNGYANIAVTFGGREGIKNIRVAPNYDGRWQGMQVITACAATGDLVGICEEDGGFIGLSAPVSLVARQPSELQVSGEFTVEGEQFPTFTSEIEADGSIKFAATLVVDGVRAEVAWQMNSAVNGRATGTIREKYTVPGVFKGDVTLDSNLSGFVRGAAGIAPLLDAPPRLIKSRIKAIRRR